MKKNLKHRKFFQIKFYVQILKFQTNLTNQSINKIKLIINNELVMKQMNMIYIQKNLLNQSFHRNTKMKFRKLILFYILIK